MIETTARYFCDRCKKEVGGADLTDFRVVLCPKYKYDRRLMEVKSLQEYSGELCKTCFAIELAKYEACKFGDSDA